MSLLFYFGSFVKYMGREGKLGNFIEKNGPNIVARSVGVLTIVAAGVAAVEKTGLFDPLSNPVNSANHLVLNNVDKSYEQLIDVLPKVEKAEADGIPTQTDTCNSPDELITWCNQLPSMKHTVNWHRAYNGGENVTFVVSQVERDNYCHVSGRDDQDIFHDMYVTSFGGTVQNPTYPCPATCPLRVNQTLSTTSCGVGGIAELPDVEALPVNALFQDMTSEKSRDNTTPIAAGIAVAVSAVAATGILYARRNRSAK